MMWWLHSHRGSVASGPQLKARFMSEYRSKDLGEPKLVLGMRVGSGQKLGNNLAGPGHIRLKVLGQFYMQQCKSVAHTRAEQRETVPRRLPLARGAGDE